MIAGLIIGIILGGGVFLIGIIFGIALTKYYSEAKDLQKQCDEIINKAKQHQYN